MALKPGPGELVREDIPAITRIAVKLTPLAIAALVQNLVDKNTSPGEKRKSAELILAYGWGRPVSTTANDAKDPNRIVIDADMREKIGRTFDRINELINSHQLSDETKDIIEPLLQLELDPVSTQPTDQ